jgi:hypothetical protein
VQRVTLRQLLDHIPALLDREVTALAEPTGELLLLLVPGVTSGAYAKQPDHLRPSDDPQPPADAR